MGEPSAVRIPLTAEALPIQDRLRKAESRKTEGNDYFRKGDWREALSTYESALDFLPLHKPELNREGSEVIPEGSDSQETETSKHEDLDPEMEKTCASLRSVLNANIGACHVKLGEHKQAVKACTRALADDPHYVKALQRRAASNEVIDSWSSLSSAQEDYNTLLKVLPSGPEFRQVEQKLRNLKPRVEAAQKKETSEMLDKLKTLGNSILGNFGLSTDNFKLEPNGQGGYSVNFNR